MDKWTHQMEPPLEVQPPTHAGLTHELVELMGCGHQMNPTVKVRVQNTLKCHIEMLNLLLNIDLLISSDGYSSDNSAIIGVIAATWSVISMVIIALLIVYIVHLRRQQQ